MSGKVRIGDIVLLQEDSRLKHIVRPIQLVIHLEVDQVGEDVEDHWN